jgi:hypothetical protein
MKLCHECKVKPACHWNRSFCESCMNDLLSKKVKEEDEK